MGNPVDFYVYYVYLVGSLSRDLFDTWSWYANLLPVHYGSHATKAAVAEGHFHGSGTLSQVEGGFTGEKLEIFTVMFPSLKMLELVELKAARKCLRNKVWDFFLKNWSYD